MALGTFTLSIDGQQLDGGAETTAHVKIKVQGRSVIADQAGNELWFPVAGKSVSLPYSVTLPSDVTTGTSTEIGYEVLVTTRNGGRAEGVFAARAVGTTVYFADLVAANEVVVTDVADAAVSALVSDATSATRAQLNAAFVSETPATRRFAKSVPPTLTAYPGQRRPHHKVMFQDGETLYAIAQYGAYTVLKSTDFGKTWTQRGTLPSGSYGFARVRTTNTLLSVDMSGYTSAGTPAIRRSTDDGANWTAVQTLAFPTLANNGIVQAADGSLLVAEYGNVANTVYRIFRSTDDGQTWTQVLASPGTDPAADPGHWHSISVDPYSGKLIAFCDRPNPELHVSTDNGATWSLLGTSTAVHHPNWVQPMFFPKHIVWGTDNQANGRICRITYADFYAGAFDAAETITLVNRKANYYTFPLRDNVWLMTQSTEVIAPGGEPDGPGSYFSEVYVVTDEGATVSASLEQAHIEAKVGTLEGLRATLPAFHYDTITNDAQNGRAWVNVNNHRGATASFSTLPVTVGYGAPKVSTVVSPLTPGGSRQLYPGWWYGPDARGNGTAGIPDGRMTLVPVWIPHAIKIDKIACEVATGVGGATVKLVGYSSDQFDRPVTQLFVTAAQDASVAGVKEVFLSPIPELAPGLYWFGAVPIGAAVSMRTIGTEHIPGMPTTAFAPGGTGATSEANGYYYDSSSTPAATLTTWDNITNAIKTMVRAAV